jgi:hypothetical protein
MKRFIAVTALLGLGLIATPAHARVRVGFAFGEPRYEARHYEHYRWHHSYRHPQVLGYVPVVVNEAAEAPCPYPAPTNYYAPPGAPLPPPEYIEPPVSIGFGIRIH